MGSLPKGEWPTVIYFLNSLTFNKEKQNKKTQE